MSTTLSPGQERSAVKAAVAAAAWGLALYAGVRVVGAMLDSMSMAALVAQVFVTEWALGRLGVAWSDPSAALPTGSQLARRAGKGVVIGAALALLVIAVLRATNAILLERANVSLAVLVLGLLTSTLVALRDELLFHGLTLRVLVSVEAKLPRALACGVVSAAAALGEPTTTASSAIVQFLFGTVLGVLWLEDRGAWLPWTAHASFLFCTQTLLRGGLFEAKTLASGWASGSGGAFGGVAALVAMAPAALFALYRAGRGPRNVGGRGPG